jgi:glutathione S-transferase
MALLVAGIRCEIREVILRDKPEEMLAVSSKGTVPVLKLVDGRVIDESLDVMYWALRQSDPEQWLHQEVSLTEKLIEQNDVDFKDQLDRYKYHVSYPEHPQRYYRDKAEEFLGKLEGILEENEGGGLVGLQISLADVALFPFLRQFSRVEEEWFSGTDYRLLTQWLARMETGYLFQSVMHKYTRWTQQSEIQFFPR